MMKRGIAGMAAALILLLTGCTPISEDIPAQTGDSAAVTVLPSDGEEKGYVYSTLSEKEKQGYDMLAAAVRGFEPRVQFSEDYTEEEIKKLFTLVYTQESRIFWLDSIYSAPGENNILSLSYRYTKEQSDSMRAQLENTAGELLGKMPGNGDDYDRIKYFHDTIVMSCTFDNTSEYSNTAYGVLVDGKAQCEGYAFAMSYLCDLAGIENYVANGKNSDGVAHAWNKICADGSWYNVDCTWDDPKLKYNDPYFLRHDYMLVPDSEVEGTAYFSDTSYFPHIPCISDDYSYFRREGLLFDTAEDGVAAFEEQLKRTAGRGGRDVEIRFTNGEEYEKAKRQLFEEDGLKSMVEKLNGFFGYGIKTAHKSYNSKMFIIHVSVIYKNDDFSEEE